MARIEKVWFKSKSSRLHFGDSFQILAEVSAIKTLSDCGFHFTFFTLDNDPVGTSFSMKAFKVHGLKNVYELTIPSLRLAPGKYYCDLSLQKGNWLHSPSIHDVVLGILHFDVEFPLSEDGTSPVWNANWGATIPEDIQVREVTDAVS
jgi:hypothetical protein